MVNYQHVLIFLMVFVALVDRFIWCRKSVRLKKIGKAIVKGEALAFPIMLHTRRSWLSDAQIEYSLQDLKNPMVVIAGKTRTVDTSREGIRDEYLLINTRYLEPGRWDLRVKITNGNCRLNLLYRLFPLKEEMEKQYSITAVEGGGWNVE